MGIVEGVLKALIVDVVERDASARGMAFGVFNSTFSEPSFYSAILYYIITPGSSSFPLSPTFSPPNSSLFVFVCRCNGCL